MSRQHARIVIDDEGARVEDLKSRNGVKVNGAPLRERHAAQGRRSPPHRHPGARLLRDRRGQRARRRKTTGSCGTARAAGCPYPQEMLACPSCGETDAARRRRHDDRAARRRVEALVERFSSSSRCSTRRSVSGASPTPSRALQRISDAVRGALAAGERLDPKQLDEVAHWPCAPAPRSTHDPAHASLVPADLCRARTLIPPAGRGGRASPSLAIVMRAKCGPPSRISSSGCASRARHDAARTEARAA